MDNLTHSLAGWALGQAGLKTKTRKGLAALILGANMPDIDVFFGNAPWDPLSIHRGFTHGLIGGVLVMPPILTMLLWLLDDMQVRSGARFKSGLSMHAGWLLLLSYLGTLTHPFLDLLTTYSVQLFSPLSSAWYHSDALFIIDPWIWLLLAVSIGISKRKEQQGKEWRRVPRAALLVLIAYIGLNLLISERADRDVERWAGKGRAEAIFASPAPVVFWRRSLVWREGSCYRQSSYDPFHGLGRVSDCRQNRMDDPSVKEAIRRDSRLQKFLKWSILPQAEVRRDRCFVRVSIGDARYGEGKRSLLARESTFPTGAANC